MHSIDSAYGVILLPVTQHLVYDDGIVYGGYSSNGILVKIQSCAATVSRSIAR